MQKTPDKKKFDKQPDRITGRYITQAISQPDRRQKKTGVALPDDENVSRARNWVDENHK